MGGKRPRRVERGSAKHSGFDCSCWPASHSEGSGAGRVGSSKVAGAPATTKVRGTVYWTLLNLRAGSVQRPTQGQHIAGMDGKRPDRV